MTAKQKLSFPLLRKTSTCYCTSSRLPSPKYNIYSWQEGYKNQVISENLFGCNGALQPWCSVQNCLLTRHKVGVDCVH